jgi:hypothetical protein
MSESIYRSSQHRVPIYTNLSLEEDSATFGKHHKKAQSHKRAPNDQEDAISVPEVSPLPRNQPRLFRYKPILLDL